MRDLYLTRKPWDQRSKQFMDFADTKMPHTSRWNWKGKGKWIDGHWVYPDKGEGPYGQVNHIFSSGAKIAYLYWLRYQYSMDKAWLRDRAYPMLKGIAEFYRNYPKVSKGPDGKYHIHDVNNHEPVRGAQDTLEEMSAMHGILPLAIRASEILGEDADLRAAWREFLDNLAPLPTNASPEAEHPREAGQPEVWVAGLKPVVGGNLGALGLVPALNYDLCAAETTDSRMRKIANATYDELYPQGIGANTPISVLNRTGAVAAHLGRAEDLSHILPNQLKALAPETEFCDWPGVGKTGVLKNRMTLREGPGAIGVERIGRVAYALQEALLQSGPAAPGGDPVIHVFPTWPNGWDAQFTLLARGAFVVTASRTQNATAFVALKSQAGGDCHLRNPWGDAEVKLYRDNVAAETLQGTLLTFPTRSGETVLVLPADKNPSAIARSIP